MAQLEQNFGSQAKTLKVARRFLQAGIAELERVVESIGMHATVGSLDDLVGQKLSSPPLLDQTSNQNIWHKLHGRGHAQSITAHQGGC